MYWLPVYLSDEIWGGKYWRMILINTFQLKCFGESPDFLSSIEKNNSRNHCHSSMGICQDYRKGLHTN